MSEISWLTANELAEAFRRKTLSPVEVVTALFDRIDRLDPHLHVFITLDREAALAEARSAEQAIRAGRMRGPLHGVPVGVKDIIDVVGLPTTCHSKILLDNVASSDAFAVQQLRQAGAIVLGKIATWEFAFGGPSFDLPFPPAVNPWKPGYSPGGSSSGSGAGIAAGFFPLALGSDTGGSIRHPAAACGIIGLKPTYGLVSRRGVFPLSFTLDHIGPMARSAADIAVLLDALAGYDPVDAGSAAVPAQNFGRHLGEDIRGLRIGFVKNFHETDLPAHPEVAAGLSDVERVFRDLGAHVEPIVLPPLQDFAAVCRVIMHSEAWSIHKDWLQTRPEDYGKLTRRKLTTGAFFGAGDYVAAQRRRAQLIAIVDDKLRDFDVLLVANAMDPAPQLEPILAEAPVNARQARTPFNVTGHPSIALMSGISQDGLPLSFQMVGRNFGEAKLLGVASAYENATKWHKMRPPV